MLTAAGVRDARDLVRLWEHRARPETGDGGEPAAVVVSAAEPVDRDMDLGPAPAQEPGLETAAEAYPRLRAELVAKLGAVADLPPELGPAPGRGSDAAEDGEAPAVAVTVAVAELAAAGAVEIHQAPLDAGADRGPLAVLTHRDLRDGAAPSGRGREVPGRVVIRPGDVVEHLARLADLGARLARTGHRGLASGALTVEEGP